MIFEYSDKVKELQERLQAFMDEHVYPNEQVYYDQIAEGDRWQPTAILDELKAKAKAVGLWNLFLPESDLGAGYRQYGGVRALCQPGAERALAETASGRGNPLRLRDDGTGGGLFGCNEYRI